MSQRVPARDATGALRLVADAEDVLVSRTVKDLVTGSNIELADYGTHTLKGVSDPWQLFRHATLRTPPSTWVSCTSLAREFVSLRPLESRCMSCSSWPWHDSVTGWVCHRRLCHRWALAASCTAAIIGAQSASGCRVTVTKSLTPNTDATPPAANTWRANGMAIACSALAALNIAVNLVSKVNFVASGFGVGEGVAVATTRS